MKPAELRKAQARNELIRQARRDNPEMALSEIGAMFGNLSRQRVWQILNPNYRKRTNHKAGAGG